MKFVESVTGLSSDHQCIVSAVVNLGRNGDVLVGDWIGLAVDPGDRWNEVDRRVLERANHFQRMGVATSSLGN